MGDPRDLVNFVRFKLGTGTNNITAGVTSQEYRDYAAQRKSGLMSSYSKEEIEKSMALYGTIGKTRMVRVTIEITEWEEHIPSENGPGNSISF